MARTTIAVFDLLADVVAALTCPDCGGTGCDTCDHTGHQRCEHPAGPAEHCETERPCARHDRELIDKAIA